MCHEVLNVNKTINSPPPSKFSVHKSHVSQIKFHSEMHSFLVKGRDARVEDKIRSHARLCIILYTTSHTLSVFPSTVNSKKFVASLSAWSAASTSEYIKAPGNTINRNLTFWTKTHQQKLNFCLTSLCDWSRKLAPLSPPIRCKTSVLPWTLIGS